MKHYIESIDNVLKETGSQITGISQAEADARLEKNGKNKLAEGKKTTLLMRFLSQLANPMVLVLIGAAIISAITAVLANESLADVKNLLKEFSKAGILKSASYSEMSKELAEILKNQNMQQNTDFVQNDTSFVAEKDGDTVGNTAGQNDGNEKSEAKQGFFEVLSNIREKYPDSMVEKMLAGNLFEKFAKGREGKIEDVFDDFYGFMSMIDAKKNSQNIDEKENSNFASTSFSSYSGLPDAGTNLTKQQMEIAKSAGMSYREYQNLLESVPKRAGRTF